MGDEYSSGARWCPKCEAPTTQAVVCLPCSYAEHAARGKALTAARAEGYAEAVADVVAWLEAKAERERTREPRTDVTWAVAVALIGAADLVEDGAHVGAAKKGGE
jgi:hypothetical protein